ncbi:MAG TPA: aspartyl protease family protein [Candidatus Angelobacter sp.]|nr:aspartyl protease family protein [Candidatus Angelobacter sp.]
MRSVAVGTSCRTLLALLLLSSCAWATPNADDDLLAAGRLALRHGDFKAAAANFQGMVDSNPSAEAYAGLVQSLLKQDDVKNAEQKSQLAVNAFPAAATAHAARADVLFRRGLLAEAADEYQAALKLDAKCARALLGSGKIEEARAERSRAREDVARAHELDSDDGDALYEWAIRQKYPNNVAGMEKHLAEFRNDPEVERHEREYLELLKALAGRDVWVLKPEVKAAEMKLETLTLGPGLDRRGFGLRVTFNDRASATLMLDTGASGVTITRKFADKIGAKKLSDQIMQGVGKGGTPAYQAWVDKVAVGDLQFHDCFVHVVPRTVADVDGLIGTDVFVQFLVTVDFPARKLVLAELPATAALEKDKDKDNYKEGAAAAEFSPTYSFGHILLLPGKAGEKASGLFVLDSGSNVSSISNELSHLINQMRALNVRASGVGGSSNTAFVASDVTIQFAGSRRRDQHLITVDLHTVSKNLGTEISGQIGFATLETLKLLINYRDGLVKVEEKSK